MTINARLLTGAAALAVCLCGYAESVAAQDDAGVVSATDQERSEAAQENVIFVTARRREETALEVPVSVTAFSGEELSRAGVSSINDIARLTPQLKTFTNIGVLGGFSAIRGITSPSGNAATDPAVLVVVNNVPVGTGGAMLLGQFDLGQAEIMKGPQALFFGKNATAGIISLTTAEPTDELDIMLRGEYEIEARQILTEGFVSGPLSDSLRGRLAVKYADQDGEFRNGDTASKVRRGLDDEEVGVRGTLIFDPSPDFSMKLKGTYHRISNSGPFLTMQRVYCPNGAPSGSTVVPAETDCSLDDKFWRNDLPLNLGTSTGDDLFPNDGVPYYKNRQWLFSLETNVVPIDGVQITSNTGYYKQDAASADNAGLGAPILLATYANDQYIFSQELRVASDTESPFSWMVGGFYQYNDLESAEHVVFFGSPLPQGIFDIRTRSLSAFAQAEYDFGNGLKASAGIRYTDDKKTQKVNLSPKFIPELKSDDWSPEVTLSYQPTSQLNIYASYKEGYKSGSFQVASIPFGGQIADTNVAVVDNSYLPETVSGFEAGIKAELFERQLRADLTAYTYKYNDLQLSQLDPATAVNRINNASGARIKGIEFSANYSPFEIPDLRLFGTVAYNDAKYTDFIAGCYVGQTLSQGCTIDGPDTNTVPDQQSLAGKPMMKAPKWSLSTGMSLSTDIGSGMKLGFDTRFAYETKSFLSQDNIPWGMRLAGGMIDASLTLGSEDGGWEIGLVGKNLTDKLYPGHLIQAFGSGSGATTGTAVGSPADLIVYGQHGREVRLRLTIRPGRL